jgi:hypothetical protein
MVDTSGIATYKVVLYVYTRLEARFGHVGLFHYVLA